jgi:ankyrin repeat protein
MSIHRNASQAVRGDVRTRPLFSGAIDWCRWRMVLVATMIAACTVGTAARDHTLIEAAKGKDLALLRALLAKNTDPNVRQGDGATALHWAAHWDDMNAATLLVRAGADVNAINDNGVTALALASTNGSATMAALLLAAGADPNRARPSGETPLMMAARTGKSDVVDALLAHGANLQAAERSKGQTALMWAAAEGHAAVVKTLLRHGADAKKGSSSGFSPLMFAAAGGHQEVTELLLAAGANVNEASRNGTTPLLLAIRNNHHAFAGFLLERGADPNADAGYTPLHWVAGNMRADADEGGSEGVPGTTPKLSLVKALLAHGANPNARAARYPDGVRDGVDFGAVTPFWLAAMAADVKVMQALVAAGADPLASTTGGTTPLMMAAGYAWRRNDGVPEADSLEAVKLCVKLGVDVNAKNALGQTAVHAATFKGANTILQFLVAHGADVNARNNMGQTALTIAELGHYRNAEFKTLPETAAALRSLGGELGAPGSGDLERTRAATER